MTSIRQPLTNARTESCSNFVGSSSCVTPSGDLEEPEVLFLPAVGLHKVEKGEAA